VARLRYAGRVNDETVSDVFEAKGSGPARIAHVALVIATCADDIAMPPSRHLLDDVDVIQFGRGKREATRDRHRGLRRLVVRVPDRAMSTEHGRLLRVQGRWMLENPGSKNPASIAGRVTRCGLVELGDILELGHTIAWLGPVPSTTATPPDQILQARPVQELASFHPELAAFASILPLLASSDLPVMLEGETGTGKEVYARAIHELSDRPKLIVASCGAGDVTKLARRVPPHGTLFLDKIDELSAADQLSMVRLLEELPRAVRVCVASLRSLACEVDAGRFRSDLHARLLGYELRLPPLRERRSDLGLLIATLLARLAPGRSIAFAPAALRALVAHAWPRNIRELERCLAMALVLSRGDAIRPEHLPEALRAAGQRGRFELQPAVFLGTEALPGELVAGEPDPEAMALRDRLALKLVEHHGNISAVARDLGKHREQVQRWLRRFGFDPATFRR
jgi:sigma-54 dependent transcriptional regulator, acetoin dehydrogenase operon transcriptional activator AcoR